MNVMFLQEINSNDPWARHDDLINPSAMTKNFGSLELIHDYLSFFLDGLFVTTDPHNEISVWEKFLGLFQNFSMANVVHVKNSISVNSHWVVRV